MKKNEFMNMTCEEKKAYFKELARNAAKRVEKNQTEKIMNLIEKKLLKKERLNIDEFEILTGIQFHKNMTGKMHDILALGTNCLMNDICIERMKDGNSICANCYAAALEMYRKTLCENTSYNYEVLTNTLIPNECIPIIENEELRIEPYGDTRNETQSANYYQFAIVNPNCSVTAWTKNVSHYKKGLKILGLKKKPDNFTLIKSSRFKNKEEKILKSEIGFVDKTFTVFTLEWLKKHGLDHNFINCGGRNCKKCQRCYCNAKSSEKNIRELLKSDTKRAEKSGFEWTDTAEKTEKTNNSIVSEYAAMFRESVTA